MPFTRKCVVRFAVCVLLALSSPGSGVTGEPQPRSWEAVEAARRVGLESVSARLAGRFPDLQAISRVHRAYRDAGLRLWTHAPDDMRRWDWLLTTLNDSPRYDATGEAAAAAHAGLALEIIRRLELPALAPDDSRRQPIELAFVKKDLREARFSPDPRRAAVVETAANLLAYLGSNPGSDENLLINEVHRDLGQDPLVVEPYFRALAASGNPRAVTYAGMYREVARHYSTPFAFSGVLLDGTRYEVPANDGRLLLFQVWNTNCPKCIEAMPKLEALQVANRDRLVVVSACFKLDSNRETVERNRVSAMRVMEKKKAAYPTFHYSSSRDLGGSGLQWDVAYYYLFGKDRRLITYSNSSADIVRAAQAHLAKR